MSFFSNSGRYISSTRRKHKKKSILASYAAMISSPLSMARNSFSSSERNGRNWKRRASTTQSDRTLVSIHTWTDFFRILYVHSNDIRKIQRRDRPFTEYKDVLLDRFKCLRVLREPPALSHLIEFFLEPFPVESFDLIAIVQ